MRLAVLIISSWMLIGIVATMLLAMITPKKEMENVPGISILASVLLGPLSMISFMIKLLAGTGMENKIVCSRCSKIIVKKEAKHCPHCGLEVARNAT